jgi:hypothetical protein
MLSMAYGACFPQSEGRDRSQDDQDLVVVVH